MDNDFDYDGKINLIQRNMLFLICALLGSVLVVMAFMLLLFRPESFLSASVGVLIGAFFLACARRDWIYQKRKRSSEVSAEVKKLQDFIDRMGLRDELWASLEHEYGPMNIHRGFTFLSGSVEIREFKTKDLILRVFLKNDKIVGTHVDPIF